MKNTIFTLSALALLSGCAGNSIIKEQSELYRVSMTQYQDYSCGQIRAEMRRLSGAIDRQAEASQDKRNEYLTSALDALAIMRGTNSGGNDKREQAVMQRLKSQYNALDQLAIQKNCVGQNG